MSGYRKPVAHILRGTPDHTERGRRIAVYQPDVRIGRRLQLEQVGRSVRAHKAADADVAGIGDQHPYEVPRREAQGRIRGRGKRIRPNVEEARTTAERV